MQRRLVLRLTAAVLVTVAVAVPGAAAQDRGLQDAMEDAGALPTPDGALRTPVGVLRLRRTELLAARFGQRIGVELELDRDVERGRVSVALPSRWRSPGPGGLRGAQRPKLRSGPRGVRLDRSDADVDLVLDGAQAGSTVIADVVDTGIPAGSYELPVRFSENGQAARRIGTLELRLYAPVREGEAESPWAELRAVNVTRDTDQESETFVSVVPGNPRRVLVGVNSDSGYSAWISSDGGATWAKRAVPASADVKGTSGPRTLSPCCDPMSAADALGNIWYGGLSFNPGSRIHVSRIAAGTDTFVNTVGLDRRTTGTQDKPMMTIDNDPQSPTFGRLYVVWNEPSGGGINVVIVHCDTRPDAARCDNADNWTSPVPVTKGAPGSYIYADAAVGPDGRLYVTWWDFSNVDAIRGATCEAASDCDAADDFSAAQTIATLDATGGAPVPFACPILAQPGGRASTSPQVETDVSDTGSEGRVWVTWSDLRSGSGSTRCDDGLAPAATHLNFDSFAASAMNALPGEASPSAAVGRRIVGDGDGAAESDDWFAWLAVDQTTGTAYADVYSTREDATRRTTHFYVRSLTPSQLGGLTRVSTAASDYSGAQCCQFGNDYGDYTGIDATAGVAFPTWSDKSGGDGEALLDAVVPPAPAPTVALAPAAAAVSDPPPEGDGDGIPEPGETLSVAIPIRNGGSEAASATSGALSSTDDAVTFPDGSAGYGTIAASATADPDAPFRVRLGRALECGEQVPLRLDVGYAGGATAKDYVVGTGAARVDGADDVPRAIPDDSAAGVSSTLTLPGGGTVEDLDVGVSIAHTWVGDLRITLRHPDGTEVTLADRPGGSANSGDDLDGTVFDDEAATAIGAGAPPYDGRFRPDEPLSAFDGKPLGGTWTLTVSDASPGETGSLGAWSLRRHACSVAPRAAIAAPRSAAGGEPVEVSARDSEDPDGTIADYAWDLDGDGAFETDTGGTPVATTAFTAPGEHAVSVRVTDDDGEQASARTTITVPAPASAPAPGATPGPGATTPTAPEPSVALVKNRGTIRARTATVRLALVGCAECRGALVLQTARRLRKRPAARPAIVRIARARFALTTRGRATVRVRLSKTNRRLLRRLRRLPLSVRFTVTSPAGKTAHPRGSLTLRR